MCKSAHEVLALLKHRILKLFVVLTRYIVQLNCTKSGVFCDFSCCFPGKKSARYCVTHIATYFACQICCLSEVPMNLIVSRVGRHDRYGNVCKF